VYNLIKMDNMSEQEERLSLPYKSGLPAWVSSHPLIAFFILTFCISWTLWLVPFALGLTDPVAFRHLNTIGAFGPALAGLAVSRLLNAREKMNAARARIEQFILAFLGVAAIYFICLPFASSLPLQTEALGWVVRITLFIVAALVISSLFSGPESLKRLILPAGSSKNPLWYVSAVLGYPLLVLAGLGISSLSGQFLQISLPDGGLPPLVVRILTSFAYIFLFGGPLNEEPGWRGFALPQLQFRFNPLLATLILGSIWGIWHFPMHINGFYASAGPESLWQELGLRVLSTLLVAFVYTWFYNKTRGNVLVCTLLHASFNTTSALIAGSALTMGLLAGLALVLVIESRMWKKIG
jgi:membrane protease YdiL (CAAX protease family)